MPIVLFTIVIREEEIRTPKYLVLPRKSKLIDIKLQIKDTFSWLKDYPNEEIHLWRLQPDQKDAEFIEQYNYHFKNNMLPEVLKFPGMSLEKSLDFYVEEYGTLDTTRQVLYVEVHRRATPWLF